jgi:hypothetical protein
VTSAYNKGKGEISPIGCRKKEGHVGQKIQASSGVIIYVADASLLFVLTRNLT